MPLTLSVIATLQPENRTQVTLSLELNSSELQKFFLNSLTEGEREREKSKLMSVMADAGYASWVIVVTADPERFPVHRTVVKCTLELALESSTENLQLDCSASGGREARRIHLHSCICLYASCAAWIWISLCWLMIWVKKWNERESCSEREEVGKEKERKSWCCEQFFLLLCMFHFAVVSYAWKKSLSFFYV